MKLKLVTLVILSLTLPTHSPAEPPSPPLQVTLGSACDAVYDSAIPRFGLRSALLFGASASYTEYVINDRAVENLRLALAVCREYETAYTATYIANSLDPLSPAQGLGYNTAVGWLQKSAALPVTSVQGNAYDKYMDQLITWQYNTMLGYLRSSHPNMRDINRLRNYLRDFAAGQFQLSIQCRQSYRRNEDVSDCSNAISSWGNTQIAAYRNALDVYYPRVVYYVNLIRYWNDYRLYVLSVLQTTADAATRQWAQQQLMVTISTIQNIKSQMMAL